MDTGLDFLKTVSKIVVHKTGDFLGNKIADTVAKSSDDTIVKPKHVTGADPRYFEEITIPPEKKKKY